MWRKLQRIFLCVLLLLILYLVFKDSPLARPFLRSKPPVFDKAILIYPRSRSNVTKIYKRRQINTTVQELFLTQSFVPTPQQSRPCKPHEAVVFIKTHKTGGSTITNIINRYADLHDIKIALPMGDFYRFRWPMPFHWSTLDLWRLDGDVPSMLCNHARYKRSSIELIIKKGAKYITILRNPIKQYESMFNYMELNTYLKLNGSKNPLADFLENPIPLLHKMQDENNGVPQTMNLVKNPMTFDLGLYPPMYENMTRVKEEMEKIDRDFELVIIMEYFDESLILLKKFFCWDVEDIVYVKFNQRKHAHHTQLSNHVKTKILEWNKADWLFYEYFNNTLWRKIREYGPSFWNDLREFRKLNAHFQDVCTDKQEFLEKGFHVNNDIRSFRLNPNVSNYDQYFCMKVIRNEIDYVDYFRKKYKPYGSYQRLLEETGRKKPSTRELLERLQTVSKIKYAKEDSVPRALS